MRLEHNGSVGLAGLDAVLANELIQTLSLSAQFLVDVKQRALARIREWCLGQEETGSECNGKGFQSDKRSAYVLWSLSNWPMNSRRSHPVLRCNLDGLRQL